MDCLPEYQRRMCAARRCERPEVRFRVDEDGFIEGYLPGLGKHDEDAEPVEAEAVQP